LYKLKPRSSSLMTFPELTKSIEIDRKKFMKQLKADLEKKNNNKPKNKE
jgi:hypothetical protein